MSTLFSWSSWLRLFGRKATPVKSAPVKVIKRPINRKRQQDFADYGTAFGLEMSLSNQASAEQEAALAPKNAGQKKKHKPGKTAAQETAAPAP